VDGREIWRAGDGVLREERLDAVAIARFGESNDEDEPADRAVRHGERGQLKPGNIREKDMVTLGGGSTEGKNFVDTAELNAAEGAGDVGEAVVESYVGMMQPVMLPTKGDLGALGLPVRISALIAEASESVGVELGAGQDGSALSGGDLLVGIEAEDSEIAEGANTTLMKVSADGFAGVFDDHQVMARGKVAKSEHVCGDAKGVDDEDGARSRSEHSFNSIGREVECDRIDIGEDGRGADLEDGVGDSDESEGWDDDFVAFLDAESEQGHVKAGGAAADGDGVRGGVVVGEGRFKVGEFGPEAEVGSAQDGGDGVDFCFGDVGRGERDSGIHSACSVE